MRYAAFLRAINVGTHNRIKMAELRELCQGAGLRDVSTYVQTGNLVFDFDGDEAAAVAAIDGALARRGLRNAAASVRAADELAGLVASNPFDGIEAEPRDRFVTLFQSPLPPDSGVRAPAFAKVVAVREREILTVRLPDAPPGGDLNGHLAKATRLQGTTRYWHVVVEVARLASE